MGEWKRAKIGDVCTIEKGVTGIVKALPGNYPLVTTGAVRKTSIDYQFDTKAVCIPLVSSTGHGKKTLNYVHYQEGKFALGSILSAVVPCDETILDARFLHVYLQKNKDRVLVPLMKGAANVSLSVTAISNIEVPLPSLVEQKKILGKIDSISNEHKDFLNESDVQIDLFRKLRQAVLQEAIEGKFTAGWRTQNPELISGDNHASKLFEKIKAEKELLIKEGKMRKEKFLQLITDDEKPFALPEGWVWCRLGELLRISSGDGLTSKDMAIGGDFPVYGGNGINGYHDKANVLKKTIVIGRVGAQCGSVHVTPEKAWVTDNAFITYYNEHYLSGNWLEKLLVALNLRDCARETAQPVISGKRVYPIVSALPSFAEQQAIVKRISELMAMIDELEKQVSSRKDQAEMLMQLVLREAFAGAKS